MSANLVLADSSLIRRPAVHSASTEQARSRRRECSFQLISILILSTHSLDEVLKVLTEESDEGQRLRQSSPFSGILSHGNVLRSFAEMS